MAAGAYIRMRDGNIEIVAPGKVTIRGKEINMNGPGRMDVEMISMPSIDGDNSIHDEQFLLRDGNGRPLADVYYTAKINKQIFHGVTDSQGRTKRIKTDGVQKVEIYTGHRTKF